MPPAAAMTALDGRIVCRRCTVAERPLARMRGLLGRRSLPHDEGLLLRPASSIHTWFMRFAIDAVFLDSELVVLGVARNLKPWRVAGRRKAKSVLELPAGAADWRNLAEGDRLQLTTAHERRAAAA